MDALDRSPALLVRAGGRLCAVPLPQVVEVVRALPIDAIPGAPAFVRGLTIVRGRAVPVASAGSKKAGVRETCTPHFIVPSAAKAAGAWATTVAAKRTRAKRSGGIMLGASRGTVARRYATSGSIPCSLSFLRSVFRLMPSN